MSSTAPANRLTADQAAQLGRLVDVYPQARELGELFAASGHELYLVGGTVRDTLLAGGDAEALEDVDLDFTTSARPDESERLLREWTAERGTVWLTGARFGTVSAERGGRQVEVTTFRADEYEPDSRHPEVTFGDDVEGDLARRDFTVNAMAVRVPTFEFVDLFGGLADLQARVLRTPIDPRVSFGDDPLRMVRLARFASTLDARAEEDTFAAAKDMAERLTTISAERIRDELVKLVCGQRPRAGIQLLVRSGLSRWVLPELDELRACKDPQHRHKDVYAHTLAVVENAIALEHRLPDGGPDAVLRLAALLHDIGKPDTREIHADGTVSFHHHEMVGHRMTKARMRELKFDNQTTKDVAELVKLHLRFHTYAMGWTDAAVRRYVRDAGPLLDRLNLLTRADVTTGNAKKAARIQARMDELEARVERLEEQEELDQLRPPVDGNAIMAHLGIPPGRVVGEAWDHLLELRIEHGPMDEQAALDALDAWWAERRAGEVDAGGEPDAGGEV